MAVLAAVLAHAGRIVGDAAGVGIGMFEERLFEQQDAVRPLDAFEAAFQSRDRAFVRASRRSTRPSPSSSHSACETRATVVGEVEPVVVAEPADLERAAQFL